MLLFLILVGVFVYFLSKADELSGFISAEDDGSTKLSEVLKKYN